MQIMRWIFHEFLLLFLWQHVDTTTNENTGWIDIGSEGATHAKEDNEQKRLKYRQVMT